VNATMNRRSKLRTKQLEGRALSRPGILDDTEVLPPPKGCTMFA
jgi:hypothetical protein